MTRRVIAEGEAGQLLVVITDLWQGEHERTEYRVTGSDRLPVMARHFPEAVGLPVESCWGPAGHEWYVRVGPFKTRVDVHTEETAAGPTVRTPCPKAANPRRKCQLCAELNRERIPS